MGFASMFEDIVDRLDGEIQEPGRMVNRETSETSQSTIRHDDEPPPAYKEEVSRLLVKDGYPSYLLKYFINWIWQYKIGQMSLDQISSEFDEKCIPLITCCLQKKDQITSAFVKEHLLK